MKSVFATTASLVAFAISVPTAAVAQQAPRPPASETELPTMRADAIEDMKVLNDKGEEIGEVEEIVRDKSTKEIRAVISVGGFLGIGDRDVTIALRDLTKRGDRLVAPSGTTKAQLEKMPKYDESKFDELPDDELVTIGSRTSTGGRG